MGESVSREEVNLSHIVSQYLLLVLVGMTTLILHLHHHLLQLLLRTTDDLVGSCSLPARSKKRLVKQELTPSVLTV